MARNGSVQLTWRRAGIAIAATPVAVWWLERLIQIPSTGWFSPNHLYALGGDLRTFYTAAYLAVHGSGELIYNAGLFQTAGVAGGGAYGPFANTPPLLLLVAPLGWVSFKAAWFLLAGLSVAGIGMAIRLLGASRPAAWLLAALLFPPVYFTITFGQVSVLWLVVMAAVYRAMRHGQLVAAGAVAGLLIMKPTLAIGLAVWWLIEWRRYRVAIISAIGAAFGYLGLSYLLFPDVWRHYPASLVTLATDPGPAVRQWAQFSFWSSWRLVFPDHNGLALLAGTVAVASVLVLIVPLLRRTSRLDVGFSLTMVLTVLATPYVIAYDWTLLLIPGVLLWPIATQAGRWLEAGMLLVVIVSGWSTVVSLHLIDRYGLAIQLAPFILFAVVVAGRREVVAVPAMPAESGR